jgi:PAS domain S-box-containing protein
LVSLDHRIIEANQAFCNMIGYTKEELVGFFFVDITHPVDVDASVDHHLKLITGEVDNYHIEKRYLHNQGYEIWGDLSVSMVRDKDSVPLYSVAQIQDITERKRAEKALQTIAEGVSGAVGDLFFNFLANYLAETLEVEYAFVGEVVPENNTVRTIAVHGNGKAMENFEYDIAGTPCENVIGQQFCIHEKDVQKEFPDDQMLVDMGIESYAGGPLFDSNGKSIGIIVVLSTHPFKHKELGESLLRILGIRCAAEFERMQAEKELNQYEEQLRNLASENIIAEEQERRRIAIELHDNIIQDLGLSKIKMGQLIQRLSADDCIHLAEEIRVLIDQIIKESRSLVFDLSLPILYDLGFEEAVKWLAEVTARKNNIACAVQDDGQLKPMGKEMKVLLFKATRELMVNICKHAHATEVNITIHRVRGRIVVSVQDNGVGFDPDYIETSSRESLKFGLFGIRERLNLLKGFVKISSLPGSGTNITLTAPLHEDH